MSAHSPGPVGASESIARFVIDPLHVTRAGNLKPSLFSHVATKGCSVQRDSIASTGELTAFIRSFLEGDQRFIWLGVVAANCDAVRNLLLPDEQARLRAVCVYDTAERDNPAHAEMCQTRHIQEADAIELRRQLFAIFGDGPIIGRQAYKHGAVWNALPQELRDRTAS